MLGVWHEALEQEYKALLEHGVWELCELPPGRKPVGSRWVYCIKTNSDGSVERYKARLIAQGFSQKPYLDYTETFAPVAKFASLWTVLAIAAEDMDVHTMDLQHHFTAGHAVTVQASDTSFHAHGPGASSEHQQASYPSEHSQV